jgi:hypothetical protein
MVACAGLLLQALPVLPLVAQLSTAVVQAAC